MCLFTLVWVSRLVTCMMSDSCDTKPNTEEHEQESFSLMISIFI